MDFMDDDFFKEKEFDVNSFIDGLGNIDKMTAFELLDKISSLKIDDRKLVFDNFVIRGKLKEGLLLESSDNQWYYYRMILNRITTEEFLSLYNVKDLKEIFSNGDSGYVSVFFAANCENDINKTVEYILKDNEMFEYFFKYCDSYSFYGLSYESFKEIILKVQNEGLKLDYWLFRSIPLEYQYDIINVPEINDDSLIFMLPLFYNSVISDFFMNDYRGVYLYDRFDIVSLVKKGIKFSDDILKKKEFFDRLKSDSFIKFRNNINNIEKYNNPIIIEDRLNEYYDELISNYDFQSGMFREYKSVLDNPKRFVFSNSYIFNFDVVCKVGEHLKQDSNGVFYYDDKDKLEIFFKNETNKKLSEVIIDALFRDNIYNVWININEMLRYNEGLDNNDRVLDEEKMAFYRMILNFDKVSNVDKINLYNRYNKSNFSLMFYEDLRMVKDNAYDSMKDKLINPSLHPEYLDKDNTTKYGIDVYDLRDKEYTMLVRTQAEFREVDHYKRGCYSIISDENTQVFGERDNTSFLYGYNSFDNDTVLHMFESDSYSSNFKDDGSRYVNRIMTSDELVKSNSGYSEVQLINLKSDEGKYRWNAKKPDFIVVFEYIRDRHIEESKRLGIPIVVISKKILDKDRDEYDIEPDAYVKDKYNEEEHRIRR